MEDMPVANMNMDDRGAFAQVKFFKECAKELYDSKEDEAAFYFEQVVDHIKQGGELRPQDAVRALGL